MDDRDGGAGGAPVVLVVEEDDAIRAMLREVLEEEGYAVREATDGAAALRLARAAPPALVVLDLPPSRPDGQVFAVAYGRAPGPRAPVLVVTADPATLPEGTAAALGAAAVLGKPFALADLLALVRRLTAGERP